MHRPYGDIEVNEKFKMLSSKEYGVLMELSSSEE
jgi:hypothetical protein